MRGFVQGADRQQTTLLPECLDDWIDEGNSVRVVDLFVDALELRDLGFDGVAVLDELEFEPAIDAAHVGVTAEKGVVMLTGHVANYAQKLAAVKAAGRVKGVRALADEIEVRHFASTRVADDEIAQRALTVLDWDIAVPSKTVKVLVRDGWVTLSGAVNWDFERKSAAEDVRKLDGVLGVINQIEVHPRVEPDDVKSKIEAALKRRAELKINRISGFRDRRLQRLPQGQRRHAGATHCCAKCGLVGAWSHLGRGPPDNLIGVQRS